MPMEMSGRGFCFSGVGVCGGRLYGFVVLNAIGYMITVVILCMVFMSWVLHARLLALRLRIGIIEMSRDRVSGM